MKEIINLFLPGIAALFLLAVTVAFTWALIFVVYNWWKDRYPDVPTLKELQPYPSREEALKLLATQDGCGKERKTHIVNALYDALECRER